jgi:hypothetical protein
MHAPKYFAALAALVLALAAAPVALAASGHPRPDDRAGSRGSVAIAPVAGVRPDDRGGTRGPAIAAVRTPTIVSVASGGFDWGSAGIGAAGGAGAILALLGAFLIIRAQRPQAQTA